MIGNQGSEPRRVRFSLRSLIVVTMIAAMAIGLVALNRQNQQLAARNEVLSRMNQQLRDELGELSIGDETQLHAIRTKNGEGLEWEWRVWIPEGHEYRLRGDGGEIPEQGWLQRGGTIYLRKAGEQVIRYRIYKDPREGKWYGKLSTRSGSVGKDPHPWVDWGSTTTTTSGVGNTTRAFPNDGDDIVELCRHRVSQQGSTNKMEDPAAGFLIWLERQK